MLNHIIILFDFASSASVRPSLLSAHLKILAPPLAALHPKCPLTTRSRSSLLVVFIASPNLNLQPSLPSNLACLRLHLMAYRVTYILIKQHYLALSTWLPAYLRQLFRARASHSDSAASDKRDTSHWLMGKELVLLFPSGSTQDH